MSDSSISTDWTELAEWWLGELEDPNYDEEVTPLFRQMLVAREGDTLLDLGCGNGRLFRLIEGVGAHPIGVDLNYALARRAAQRGPVVIGELPDLGFLRTASVDGAYSVLSLEHVPGVARLFSEAGRVVRESGRLTAIVNHPVYTAPGAGPVVDPTDNEVFWRFGTYLARAETVESTGSLRVAFRHRPIGYLLTAAASAGWMLEELREQGVGPAVARRDDLLALHGDIPHLMGLRWRKQRPRPA